MTELRESRRDEFDVGCDTCNYKRGEEGKNCISLEIRFVSMLIRGNSGYTCSPAITRIIYPNVITRYHDRTTIKDLDDVRAYFEYIYTLSDRNRNARRINRPIRLVSSREASFGKPRSNQFRVTAGRKKPPLLVARRRKKGTKLLKFWYQPEIDVDWPGIINRRTKRFSRWPPPAVPIN